MADQYARHRACHPGVLEEISRRVGAETKLLEVGCGTANYLAALYALTGCTCWGVDPSQRMLAVARARCPEAQLLLGSGEGLPCPSDFFDLVLSIDVIHHIDDRGAYFAEAYRVLKPGGSLCTVTDSEEIIRGRHPQSTYFPETVDVELGRYPSVQQLKGLSSSAGFIHWRKSQVQLESQLTSAEAYAAKAMSSLHLISPEAFASGLERLENDLRRGPVSEVRAYVLLWATKPLAV